MKVFIKILWILFTTGWIFFLAVLSSLPFVDSSEDYLIPWILFWYFIFWVYTMYIMIKKMFF